MIPGYWECQVFGGGNLGTFISPVDLSGGAVSCKYVLHPSNKWDSRAIKATVRYAKWLVDFLDV